MSAPINPDTIAQSWTHLRSEAVRVHCITNSVVQNFTANMLLAAGAIPSMTTDRDEIGDFVASADALLVNLGTMDADRREAIRIAVGKARDQGKSWLLDPVFIDRAPGRCEAAKALLRDGPAVIRCNQAEMTALSGTDAACWPDFARRHNAILAISGEKDRVIDGTRAITIENGHAWGALVTGGGCALSAIMSALLARAEDKTLAVATAFCAYGIAQEQAALTATGPGSFAVELIDAIYAIDAKLIQDGARIS